MSATVTSGADKFFYEAYPHQKAFHESHAPYRLLGGAAGPGKTYALILERSIFSTSGKVAHLAVGGVRGDVYEPRLAWMWFLRRMPFPAIPGHGPDAQSSSSRSGSRPRVGGSRGGS